VGGSQPAGLLVPPGDLVSLENAMLLLRNDAQQRENCGANAQSRFRSDYSISMMCQRYMESYLGLLGMKTGQSSLS